MSKELTADATELLDNIEGALSDANDHLDGSDLSAFIVAVNRLWAKWKARWRCGEQPES